MAPDPSESPPGEHSLEDGPAARRVPVIGIARRWSPERWALAAVVVAALLGGLAAGLAAGGWTGPGGSGPAGSPGIGAAPPLKVPVLIYHAINPLAGSQGFSEYEMTTQLFDAQLRALRAQSWRTITAGDLATLMAHGGQTRGRTFVITIDDGLADGLTDALPVLKRYGFTATYYIVPGLVGTDRYLSWEGVRALRDAGMEIGNHSLSHPRMSDLKADQADLEVREAQRVLEEQLGEAPITFAYPGGAFNDIAVRAVRDAGLLAAFTTEPGFTETWATRLTIPRIHVHPDATPQQLLRVLASAL